MWSQRPSTHFYLIIHSHFLNLQFYNCSDHTSSYFLEEEL
jgi:hypothetical protein